jgi:hypothetical protein
MKCKNFIICKYYINKSSKSIFCKNCKILDKILHITKVNNNNNKECPICLENINEKKAIKKYNCNHLMCIKCIQNVYYDFKFKKNMPVLDLKHIRDDWNYFIKSNYSFKIKKMIENNYNTQYFDKFCKKNKDLIPNKFKLHFKKLVKFEIQKKNYINEYFENKKSKIKSIKNCPLCRSI